MVIQTSGGLRFARTTTWGKNDRSYHEAVSLVRAIKKAGCVDQLNLGGNCCLEVLFRRLQAIVEAVTTGNWAMASVIEGASGQGGLMTDARRQEVNRQAKEKLELELLRARVAGKGNADKDLTTSLGDGGLPSAPYLRPTTNPKN